MTHTLDAYLWSGQQLEQALTLMADDLETSGGTPAPCRWQLDTHPNQWFKAKCDNLALESQRVSLILGDFQSTIAELGPSILKLNDSQGKPGYLVIQSTRQKSIKVLLAGGRIQSIKPLELLDGLIISLKSNENNTIDKLMTRFEQTSNGLSDELYRKLFVSLLSDVELNQIWTISGKDQPNMFKQLMSQGLAKSLSGFVFGLIATQLFFMTSWFVLGSNVLSGRPGTDWLSIWLMLLLGFIVSRLYSHKRQMSLSLMISSQIKRRMLIGMTNMPLQAARSDGPCNLLTRCYESGQFESASVSLVLGALSTMVTLTIALITLITLQMWGLLIATFLVGLLMIVVMWRLYLIELQWTNGRLVLTHSLAELMIGQRTRRVQEAPELRHQEEDTKLRHYIDLQKRRDLLQVIYGLIPSGWNVLGIGVLLIGFATQAQTVHLAGAIGIWLLISGAIGQLSTIYLQVIHLAVAWKTIAPLLRNKAPSQRKDQLHIPEIEHTPRLLEVRDIAYRYPNRNVNVLDGGSLQMASDDKVILEGRSGSGKSTLISLLTGIRQATRGSILMKGVEQNMVSKAHWRQRVVMVPQYHENFLFTETLAFNLLLGTQWPAEPEQLDKARQICHELGLTELLNKMPAELMQVVGEMGWNLSHGEKSRVFVARAILQQPDLLILDESLASLDPVNSNRVLDCVEKHCKAVIIVAHP